MGTKRRQGHGGRSRHDDSHNRSPQTKGNRSRGLFVCDICGTTVTAHGHNTPFCPRCMIPMRSSQGNLRKSSRGSGKNNQKSSFNYASRIYYQTDGHPQYIGLPVDHPDPDDEEAMAHYNRKKSSRGRGGRNESNRSRNQRTQRNRSPKRSRHAAESSSSPADTDSGREKPAAASSDSGKSPEKPGRTRTARRRPSRKQRKSPLKIQDSPEAPPVADSDFAGTALTSDRSAVSILQASLDTENAPQNHDLTGSSMSSSADKQSGGQTDLPMEPVPEKAAKEADDSTPVSPTQDS